jgi:parallel beta-helix repeat protein
MMRRGTDTERAHRRRRRPHLQAEALEGRRLLAAIITVDDAGDANARDGVVTLREAILLANADPSLPIAALVGAERTRVVGTPGGPGPSTIAFAIPGGGLHTITPSAPLPSITARVILDGYSQPGSSRNTLPLTADDPDADVGDDAVLLIELAGGGAGPGADGLTIMADDSVVQGLIINRFGGSGVHLLTGGGNTISGNFIGTDADGRVGAGNGSHGVLVERSAGNIIGGAAPADRNLISGNLGFGVSIQNAGATGNVVLGNFIGTDVTGTSRNFRSATGNGFGGVAVFDSSGRNTIGGAAAGAGNVISGNAGCGVLIQSDRIGSSDPSTGNLIRGNLVGVDRSGTRIVVNADAGVDIIESPYNAVEDNILSGNNASGIVIASNDFTRAEFTIGNRIQGNLIGTDVTGTSRLSNRADGIFLLHASFNTIGGTTAATRNVISGNDGAGIEIEGVETTGNLVQGNFIGIDRTGRFSVTLGLGNSQAGVLIANSSGNTIGGTTDAQRNVISGNTVGVVIQTFEDEFNIGVLGRGSANSNVVQGNFIGTNQDGTVAGAPLSNLGEGVLIIKAALNTIGGTVPGAGNLISGNRTQGVSLTGPDAGDRGRTAGSGLPTNEATGNVVVGNRIGTDAGGVAGIANGQSGVFLMNARDNLIGGQTPEARNVVSGNGASGIQLVGPFTTGNVIQGNFLGTDSSGTRTITPDGVRLGNNLAGVFLTGAARGNLIGGATPGTGNVIAGNALGLLLNAGTAGNSIQGNRVGTDPTGTIGLGNTAFGFLLLEGAAANTIGGTATGAGNLVSANGLGLSIVGPATNNVVQGNLIGTDAAGALQRALGNFQVGVFVNNSSGNTIGGTTRGAGNVISGNIGSGVQLFGPLAEANLVLGNLIGLDAAGTAAAGLLGGNSRDGVLIQGAPRNTIGGTTPGARNVISNNGAAGLRLLGGSTSGNLVEGNFVGTDAGGAVPLGNALDGIVLNDAPGNTIGGATPGAGNVLAGNGASGVQIVGGAATGNLVQGNRIGTDPGGVIRVPNALSGVLVNGAPDNTIGGTSPAAGNVISGNLQDGIRVFAAVVRIAGNVIGTDATGRGALGNGRAGVLVEQSSGVIIGGTDAGAGNLISANATAGILISGTSSGILVAGNSIGTDVDGVRPLGNDVGVFLDGVSGNTIGGAIAGALNLISGNRTTGIKIAGVSATGNLVAGNRIGTDRAGVRPLRQGQGVLLSDGAMANTVGGTTEAARNVLSGNGVGVEVDGPGTMTNRILGNSIGTDASGTAAVGNTFGILIRAPGNTVGGAEAGAGNLIAGNDLRADTTQVPPGTARGRRQSRVPDPPALSVGVYLMGPDAAGNLVQGNSIGLARGGRTPLPNANGVFIEGASTNRILDNVISANRSVGVYILGPGAADNEIRGNRIGTARDNARAPLLGNIRYGVLLFNAPQNGPGPQANTPRRGVGSLILRTNRIRGSRIANFREFTGPVTTVTGRTRPR